jgi:hypothetical protein
MGRSGHWNAEQDARSDSHDCRFRSG